VIQNIDETLRGLYGQGRQPMVTLTIQRRLSALTPSHGRPSLDVQPAA